MAKKRKQARPSARNASRSAGSARRTSSASLQAANPELLSWALQGLQQQIDATRNRLTELEAQARSLRASSRAHAAPAVAADAGDGGAEEPTRRKSTRRRRRKLSPEARTRIADAQKRRWEAYRESKKKK